MDATLNSLDDAILPSANWVLQLQGAREELKATTGIEVTHLDICSFQERVAKPFIRLIKGDISSLFRSFSKMCYQPSVFFIQRKCPASLLMSYLYMETVQFKILIGQFERDLPAKSLEETEFEKVPIVSSDLSTEWKKYREQPKDDISMQLKELLTSDMLTALFSNLHKLATICLSIPISTASAEQSFSDMKLIAFVTP